MARSGMRSSALARAQSQLAGQRVPVRPKDAADELQEYMHALSKKTSALKLSQPPVSDLSDSSAEEQDSEKYRATASPQQLSGTHSRFLKKKTPSSNDVKKNAIVTTEAKMPAHPQPVQSKMPTSAALRRLAEIEYRHQLRKSQIDISENDSDLRTSEERPFSNRSSSEFSTREKIFLKKKVNIMEPEHARQNSGHVVHNKTAKSKPGTIESEEEEMLHLVGSSVEFSENDERWQMLPKPPRTPSPPSKSTPRRKLRRSPSALGFVSPRRPPSRLTSRTPSPSSYGSPRFPRRPHSLTRFLSRSPSPSVRSSLTSPSPRTRLGRRSRTPMSQRSDIKSLDELFFRSEDLSSASSNDFKLNILSLDDLALPVDAEESKEKVIREKAKDKYLSSAQDKGHTPTKEAKSLTRHSTSDEESVVEAHTETNKESEILTHRRNERSSSSDKSTVNSLYSEDFEESVLTDTEHSSASDSRSYSKSMAGQKSILSSDRSYTPPNKARQRKTMAENIHRVTVKEIAVQTSDAGFTYRWPHASIDFKHTVAPFMDPVSMVSHVVSPDLIEALTTYNPMALALNDMLKQQLFLTQSFVDMARQLYLSTVKSLEGESFCYTTLKNTKEYIQQQRALKWKHGQETS
ncbi:uncharacterized protein C19orf44 homolog [Bufo bufo]|uniref:uncharacterized protein C19orf44 homolog n=1 Tax=Bufo bufo TaxID=8384 RepID=UPI001ABEA6C6|nr:uncharacterized protein C19orf44 homolog [Bufo bufo]XP_040273372.1 uncharacterized protein C19orf44 homolog [Bufo bufo]XP_040273373.1 uncharacterized protein C19orf44 homolog [Bufo bufo]XP_040273374.1 uncharacterized protein C19orf44 homolog [Bufo bufo]XP_040273375.1 uncharacterized protein C19orf44 homolog [Bufo bufo]XP_040273377.1 uncharacterized protein C19orf44 homolog [Bufo bufo]XP_040273378.1 uncharacterized protein C19orf44 homolog [Bufo bufo]